MVIVGIINTIVCFVDKKYGAAFLSLIAIYPWCLCYRFMYGTVHVGGFPVFLFIAVCYLGGGYIYAMLTIKKELIQFYMLFVFLQVVFLIEAI